MFIVFYYSVSKTHAVKCDGASPREKILDNVEQSCKKYNPAMFSSILTHFLYIKMQDFVAPSDSNISGLD